MHVNHTNALPGSYAIRAVRQFDKQAFQHDSSDDGR